MQHGFKRDQDTWQAFPGKKRKYSPFFAKIDTKLHFYV
jgi:hypothetical protein